MPKDKSHDRNRTAIRHALLLLVVGCLSLAAHANVAAPNAFDRFMEQATGAGKQTVNFGRDGTPVAAPGVPNIKTDGTPEPKASQSGTIRNPSGNPVPVTATRKIPAPAVGKAVGRAIAKALPGVGAAIAIKELAEELGWKWEKKTDGSTEVGKPDGMGCADGGTTCYEYTICESATTCNTPYGYVHPSAAAACTWFGIHLNGYYTVLSGDMCKAYQDSNGAYENQALIKRRLKAGEAELPKVAPATNQEFLDEIARQSGWPAGSKINDVLSSPEAADGEKIETIPHTITGPATTPGKTSTTTTTPATGTPQTTTSTTTHNHSYMGDTITTTNITNTVITNTTTGDTISNTTTTEEPAPEKEPEDACKANPDRVGCLDVDTPDLEIPKETKTITYSEENVFGNGSCPANLVANVGTLGRSITVWDWQKTCDYSIGLRALVIALATFAAALIIMPGSPRT